jgi:hypothetical protein
MHSGFGFLALPRTRPPIEEVANELSSRWLALDRIDDLIKEVPAHFLAQTPAESLSYFFAASLHIAQKPGQAFVVASAFVVDHA